MVIESELDQSQLAVVISYVDLKDGVSINGSTLVASSGHSRMLAMNAAGAKALERGDIKSDVLLASLSERFSRVRFLR